MHLVPTKCEHIKELQCYELKNLNIQKIILAQGKLRVGAKKTTINQFKSKGNLKKQNYVQEMNATQYKTYHYIVYNITDYQYKTSWGQHTK